MDIVGKIDEMRKERGWSVNRLATEAMLTQSTVANMFKSGAEPKIATLRALCEALGVTLSEFFYEGDPVTASPRTMELLFAYERLAEKEKRAVYELIKNLAKKG